jgi:hypothetical protein
LRGLGFYWGVFGVVALLGSAVLRIGLRVLELRQYSLSPVQWGVLLGFGVWMLYAEGIKGFHYNFAPRVVARACHLREHPRPVLALLAPLFCMGYIHATRKRRLTSILVTSAIVLLVLTVRLLPQPWRGIIDCGVVAGLAVGIGSLLWYWARALFTRQAPPIALDLP